MFDPDYRGTVTTEDFETDSTVHAGMDPRDLAHVIALYDGEIRYTDEHLGRVIELLRRLGVLDDTLVVVTADHGEEFYEHGNKGHHKTLYDESIRVPLVLRFPRRVPAGTTVDAQARLADVAPTILALTDTPVPPVFGLDPSLEYAGRSLLPALGGVSLPPVPAFASLQPQAMAAVRRQDRKLIVSPFATPSQLLFDLAADPGEQRDRTAADAATAAALNGELRAWKDTAALAAKGTDAAAMDDEHKAALRALGYVK
jgi:arylsulfatase A-like enzyme